MSFPSFQRSAAVYPVVTLKTPRCIIDKKKPTIESFKWNTAGWQSQDGKADNLTWHNVAGDFAVQMLGWQTPTGLPSNWRDVDTLRAHLADKQPPKLATVSVDVFSLPTGITCAQYVSKEFMPEPSLGHMYTGMITMPFRDFYCNIVFAAMEHGTTGLREAALVATGKVQLPAQKELPVVRTDEDLDRLYREARQGRPKLSGTDDEQWDAAFPDHPVSRVRAYLRNFRASLEVDSSVKEYPPFGG